MLDPWEGVAADGTVVTGAARSRIAEAFWPLVNASTEMLADASGVLSVHVYGSVATGQAVAGRSDLDLLVVAQHDVAQLATVVDSFASMWRGLVRGIGVSVITVDGLVRQDEFGRADRCFVRDYCVRLAGPDPVPEVGPTRADHALVRGFAGDLPIHLADLASSGVLAPADRRRLGRRLLMASATLASVDRGGWSTDRGTAVDLLRERASDGIAWAAERVLRGLDQESESPPDERDLALLAAWLIGAWPAS